MNKLMEKMERLMDQQSFERVKELIALNDTFVEESLYTTDIKIAKNRTEVRVENKTASNVIRGFVVADNENDIRITKRYDKNSMILVEELSKAISYAVDQVETTSDRGIIITLKDENRSVVAHITVVIKGALSIDAIVFNKDETLAAQCNAIAIKKVVGNKLVDAIKTRNSFAEVVILDNSETGIPNSVDFKIGFYNGEELLSVEKLAVNPGKFPITSRRNLEDYMRSTVLDNISTRIIPKVKEFGKIKIVVEGEIYGSCNNLIAIVTADSITIE